MLGLCPEGFEEHEADGELELTAYVDPDREERLRHAFGGAEATEVAAGWEDAWRAFHRPVRIGPLWVGPPWEVPDKGTVAVVIDPGQAFGTGAHPTTRLCLELLLGREPGSLADLGCGSGVLAIAAAKLGFGPVVAVDREQAAVEATRANAGANGAEVEARLAELLTAELPETDLALANLERGLVEQVAQRLPARGLIASGYLASGRPAPRGWSRRECLQAEGWAAELFERP